MVEDEESIWWERQSPRRGIMVEDEDIKVTWNTGTFIVEGDGEVRARGTKSIVQKQVCPIAFSIHKLDHSACLLIMCH